MNAATRLGSYSVILVLALGGGAALGKAVGPATGTGPKSAHGHGMTHDGEPSALPGLAVSDLGYTLVPDATVLRPGADTFRFHITAPDGTVVSEYERRHDKELHLIVVSRDLGYYAHVHPQRADDGTWSVQLADLGAGPHRVFADFQATDGPALTLGVDVVVPGDYRPPALPEPDRTAHVDGFEVELQAELDPAGESKVVVQVTRDGAPAALEPYLGATGHLVANRAGDLAYLHVHPEEDGAAAGQVPFSLHVPSDGRYRLFFDFNVGGVVRNAAFTVDVP